MNAKELRKISDDVNAKKIMQRNSELMSIVSSIINWAEQEARKRGIYTYAVNIKANFEERMQKHNISTDHIKEALRDAGFKVEITQGTGNIIIDWSKDNESF